MSEEAKKFLVKVFKTRKRFLFFIKFLAISALLLLVIMIFKFNLSNGLLLFAAVLFYLFCASLLVIAGRSVFKSLFLVSAELSLMIFLAQSYCALPGVARTANAAMQFLLECSLFYIAFVFLQSLYVEWSKILETFKDINDNKKPWVVIILFFTFVTFFVWQLYQVMKPLITNLCIYKHS